MCPRPAFLALASACVIGGGSGLAKTGSWFMSIFFIIFFIPLGCSAWQNTEDKIISLFATRDLRQEERKKPFLCQMWQWIHTKVMIDKRENTHCVECIKQSALTNVTHLFKINYILPLSYLGIELDNQIHRYESQVTVIAWTLHHAMCKHNQPVNNFGGLVKFNFANSNLCTCRRMSTLPQNCWSTNIS